MSAMLRTITLVISGINTALLLWLLTVAILVTSSERATAFIIFPSAALLLLTVPAFVLALKRRFLGLALALALLSLVSIVLVA